jgi:hypothetical protein
MRFNSRACALMDIPDLPAMAFQHIGDKKIKPQGGGGSFNPISAITDPISSAIGTDGGGGGILGALADIDPGPAIGSGLAEVDTFVNREIPGGWTLPAVIAVAYLTGYLDPSLLAAEGATVAGTAEGAALAGEAAFSSAVASGATAAEATALANAAATSYATAGAAGGTAAGTGLTAGAGASGGLLASGGTVGSLAGAGSAAGIAGTQAAAGLGIAGGSALAGTGAAIGGGTGTVGSLNPALPSTGSVGGAGAGLSAELPPGVIMGTGLEGGGAIGSTYMLGTNGLPAVNAAGQLIPATSVSIGGQAVPTASLGVKDVLDAARLGKGLLTESPATPAGATAQFRGSTIPQGGVDYSGILNLLQARSPQRNPYSLLG